MKIAFDAKRIFNNFTGLGNYGRAVVANLAKYYPENEYHLFTPKIKETPETAPFLKPPFHLHKGSGAMWRTSGINKDLQKNEIDIYHGLSHEIPIGIQKTGIKSVVTIHDLIIKVYPKQFPFFDRQIYDFKFKYACENADTIIAISESTKQDIVKYYGVSESKIKVNYLSANPIFEQQLTSEQKGAVLKKYDLPTDYLLYVGSIIERKNLLSIIKAMEQLPADLDLPLVVVGKGKFYFQKIKKYLQANPIRNQIIFTKYIETADLPAIYQAAQIFLFPSIYEGFGIPVIEALHSQTPVITSNISSLPEAGGPSSLLINPTSVEEISNGISTILKDASLQQQMISEGKEYVKRFDGEILANELMNVFTEIV